eukprot:gb/GEZN01015480.1/.p1 GENE.gb/GEZN01015480.1/~~gb/GEZN01015480.1/.p1  ORF type:complete len:152 (+),score=20.05 gb/GEZN01015480.1/:115-570(+)
MVPLHVVTEHIFQRIGEQKKATEADLKILHFLYANLFEKSVGIAEAGMVTRVTARPSGRQFFQVEGSQLFAYQCLPCYCPCPAFTNSVLMRPEAETCKHLLAIRFAVALSLCKEEEVSDSLFVRRLMSDNNEHSSTGSSWKASVTKVNTEK